MASSFVVSDGPANLAFPLDRCNTDAPNLACDCFLVDKIIDIVGEARRSAVVDGNKKRVRIENFRAARFLVSV